jgi:putative ABC transport system permease protein
MEIRALLRTLWRNKTGPLLVSAQIAITLAILVNVTYLVHERVVEVNKPTGLDLDNMFWIYTQPASKEFNFQSAVTADLIYLNSLPGVVAATTTNNLPQSGFISGAPFASNPEALQRPNGAVSGQIFYATDRYIDAMGLKLVAGRNFDPAAIKPPLADENSALADWAGEIIVTQTMAKLLFPHGDALGKAAYTGLVNKSATIVGIVADLQAEPVPARLDSYSKQVVLVPIMRAGLDGLYVVRTKPGQRAALMAQLERSFADLQPGRFLSRIEDFNSTAAVMRQHTRASTMILAVVAALVLAVTIVGISGLAAFNVTARTKQLGIRRAIGARRFHILRYFLIENWIITTCGASVGCVLGLLAGIQLSTMYQMERLPLYYLVGGVLLVWIVSLLAVLIPARRAASISPAVATRNI